MPTECSASRAVSRRFDVATAQVTPAAMRSSSSSMTPGYRRISRAVLARFHSR